MKPALAPSLPYIAFWSEVDSYKKSVPQIYRFCLINAASVTMIRKAKNNAFHSCSSEIRILDVERWILSWLVNMWQVGAWITKNVEDRRHRIVISCKKMIVWFRGRTLRLVCNKIPLWFSGVGAWSWLRTLQAVGCWSGQSKWTHSQVNEQHQQTWQAIRTNTARSPPLP